MATRRRILKSVGVIAGLVLIIAAVLLYVIPAMEPKPLTAKLADGKHRVTLLATGVGSINYSSDSAARALVRKWLPFPLAGRLGPVKNVNVLGQVDENGSPQFIVLFDRTQLDGSPSRDWDNFLARTEFEESTGFTFVVPNHGSSGYGDGLMSFEMSQFPRRDRELHVRLYERQAGEPYGNEQTGQLLMEFTIPNPAYKADYPVWTPAALPQSHTSDPVTATVRAITAHSDPSYVSANIGITFTDPMWEKHSHFISFEDATGNSGQYLSPFEPAWKLHVLVRRTMEAQFAPAETWVLDALPNPAEATFQKIDLNRSIDGLPFGVRYVASAGVVREEGGVMTVQPPRSPGSSGMSTSSGTNDVNGKQVPYLEIENGQPFFIVTQPQLPPETELLTFVRDQDGRLLNSPGGYSTHGIGGVNYRAVTFTPDAGTKTVQLTIAVNHGRSFEFLVAPPNGMQSEALARKSATAKD
jgi:hypothetical protein